jgi:hypothetical protein
MGEAGACQHGERPTFGASWGQGMRMMAPSPGKGMEYEAKDVSGGTVDQANGI